MAEIWRLLDTGLTAPAPNIALSRALLEARHAHEIPNTLRFSRVTPCVLLGCQQSAAQELDIRHCRTLRLPVQRRITGGPAAYLDQRQLVWELYLGDGVARAGDLESIVKRVCHAAATAVAALGVDARYRARRDIEIDGRVIGTGGFSVEGDALLFQGFLLIDADAGEAWAPLRSPWRSSAPTFASEARKRIVSLREALGRQPDMAAVKHNLMEAFESEFDVECREADLGLTEQARARAAVAEIDTPLWVDHVSRPASDVPLLTATHSTGAGALHATVAFERATRGLKRVWFGGEAAVGPLRTVVDLEAALQGVSTARVVQRVESFFAGRPADMRGFTPGDFSEVLLKAARQRLVAGNS